MPRELITFENSDFQTLEKTSLLAVSPVGVRWSSGAVCGLGSAFAIAVMPTGHVLYATARHVVDEVISAYEREESSEPFLLVPPIPTTPRALVGVRVTHVAAVPSHSDVALLLVNFKTSREPIAWRPHIFRITVAKPRVGEKTLALGYSELRTGVFDSSGTATFVGPFHASQGWIQMVHPCRRDRSMVNFPSFRSTAFYRSGMSGGPIIGESGSVIGITSTSFDHGEDGALGTSYGAIAAALMELKIGLPDEHGQWRERTLAELSETGELATEESTVNMSRTDDGLCLSWPDD